MGKIVDEKHDCTDKKFNRSLVLMSKVFPDQMICFNVRKRRRRKKKKQKEKTKHKK